MDQKELRKECLAGEYKCFPICKNYLSEGKKVVKVSKKKNETVPAAEQTEKVQKEKAAKETSKAG